MANSSDDALVGLGNLCKSYAGNREVLLRDRDTGVVTATMWVDLDDLRALLTAYATVQAELDTERMRLAGCGVAAHGGTTDGMAPEYDSDSLQAVLRLRIELATLRETLVGEVEARLHEKRMSFEMSGPHGDVDYRATFSFDEGGSWVRWPEIAAILNAIKGTP